MALKQRPLRMQRFRQVIEPTSRGRILFRIALAGGWQMVLGRRLSPNFAATKYPDAWVVTHLPTGKQIGAEGPTLAACSRLVKQIEKLTDWSRVQGHPGPHVTAKVAKVTGRKLMVVG